MPWLWLVPLTCATLYVWGEILLGCWQQHTLTDVRDWRARLLEQRGDVPCVFCHSPTHDWEEHVKFPQRELLMRDEDDLWRMERGG